MRDLRALNLVYHHRNLRLFDAQRRVISHQRLDLFVRVWCAYEKRTVCTWPTAACVWYTSSRGTWVRSRVSAKNEKSREQL